MNKISKANSLIKKGVNLMGNSAKKHIMGDKEARLFMLNKCSRELAERAELEVPENGKFSPKGIAFLLNGTDDIAVLEVSHNVNDPKILRDFNIGARHKNSDKIYYNYGIFTGTKKEILNFLKNIDTKATLKDIMALASKVDESYSDF